MKIPVFYKCSRCQDIFEVIGGDVICPKCMDKECEKLEGEEKLKCLIRNKDLLVFQKFHEIRKLKDATFEILEWFKVWLGSIPEENRPMLSLYKILDLVKDRISPHTWTWKECKKENFVNDRYKRNLSSYGRKKKRRTLQNQSPKYQDYRRVRYSLPSLQQWGDITL